MKTCSRCDQAKPRSEFYRDRQRPDGLYCACKECTKDSTTRSRKKHADRARSTARDYRKRNRARLTELQYISEAKRLYGVSAEDLRAMEARQGGVCAVCGDPRTKGKRLCIDHDHTTGEVRGLLCDRCNKGIGLFRDDPATIMSAINYLKKGQA